MNIEPPKVGGPARLLVEFTIGSDGAVLSRRVVSASRVGVNIPRHRKEDETVSRLHRAIEKVGGIPGLADYLGVTRAAIYQWLYRNKVTCRNATKIEELLGERDSGVQVADNLGVALLRDAMDLMGGHVALASRMGCQPKDILRWLTRNKVSEKNIDLLRKIISEWGLTNEKE